jgi:hypothetical protein
MTPPGINLWCETTPAGSSTYSNLPDRLLHRALDTSDRSERFQRSRRILIPPDQIQGHVFGSLLVIARHSWRHLTT